MNATAFGRLPPERSGCVYIGILIAVFFRCLRGIRFLNASRMLAIGYLLVFRIEFRA